ncbi:MAG TPA: ABC transporter ATP-binding protein [Methanomicrobia archaeon]|nr:ABC transporter ATP-binding protein [Methanomicrobia archaeon]
MVTLKIKDLAFGYASAPVLAGVSLEVGTKEIVAVLGPNGAGKSTLLKCIDRILHPQHGTILLDGEEISHMSRLELARRIGYIPQSLAQAFSITVFDAVLMGRRPHISWRTSEQDTEKVLHTLEMLHIEDLAMRDISELSGGQMQQVFIARALVQEPEVLLLDEPTSNLDIRHQLEVMHTVKSIVRKNEISAMMAIHDLNLAARFADKIVLMNGGGILSVGNPATVITPENIRVVFKVDADVYEKDGKLHVVPLRAIARTT